jgi:hypothetical protein
VADALASTLDEVAASLGTDRLNPYRERGTRRSETVYYVSSGKYWILFTYRKEVEWVVAQAVLHNQVTPSPADIPTDSHEFD